MSKSKLATTLAATGVMASALVVVPATTASAGPLICDPGSTSVRWVVTDRSRVLTHKVKLYEKGYTGGSMTVTRELKHDKTVTAGWSVEAGVTAGFNIKKVLKSLDANVTGSYEHSTARTTSRSVKVADKLSKKGRYFFYRGTVRATGTWEGYRCDRGDKWVKLKTWGKARTFSAETEGVVRCGESVSRKSLGALVQKRYC